MGLGSLQSKPYLSMAKFSLKAGYWGLSSWVLVVQEWKMHSLGGHLLQCWTILTLLLFSPHTQPEFHLLWLDANAAITFLWCSSSHTARQQSLMLCHCLSWTSSLGNLNPWKPNELVLQRGWGCTIILSEQFHDSTQRLISNKEPEAGRPYPRVPPVSSALLRIHWAPWLEVSWVRHSNISFSRGLNILPSCGLYQPQLFIKLLFTYHS